MPTNLTGRLAVVLTLPVLLLAAPPRAQAQAVTKPGTTAIPRSNVSNHPGRKPATADRYLRSAPYPVVNDPIFDRNPWGNRATTPRRSYFPSIEAGTYPNKAAPDMQTLNQNRMGAMQGMGGAGRLPSHATARHR